MWMHVVWWKVDLVKWYIFPIGCLDEVFLQLIYIHSISLSFHIQNRNQALLTRFRKPFFSPLPRGVFKLLVSALFLPGVFPVVPRHAPKTQPKSEIGAGSGIGSARIAASMPSSEARYRAPNHQRSHSGSHMWHLWKHSWHSEKKLSLWLWVFISTFFGEICQILPSQGSSILDF